MKKLKRLRPLTDAEELRLPPGYCWQLGVWRRTWGLFELHACDREMHVAKLASSRRGVEWEEVFSPVRLTRLDLEWSESMASKWIKAAVSRRVKGKPGAYPAEPFLCGDRPALQDFLTEVEGPSGGVREPSILMISLTADGVRCGLKDDDCGGWCWRQGRTLGDALDAIEKALKEEEGAFKGPKTTPSKKKR